MRIVLAGIAAVALLLPFVSHAQMYKCVDERGRVQFRDVPCKGMVKPKPKPKPAAPAAEESRQSPAPSGSQNARRQKAEADRAAVKEQKSRCAALRRERLAIAREGGPQVFNAAGERVFTDAKRADRFAMLNRELRGCP